MCGFRFPFRNAAAADVGLFFPPEKQMITLSETVRV